MKRVLLIIGALLLGLTGAAQTQGRGPVRHTQSDGRIVSYVATGTKPNIYAQTLDGYTLWHTATGDIVYATTDSTGQMVPSTVLAADQRTAEEEAFLGTLPKGLRFLDIPSPLKAGHLLAGGHFPHTATESDSLLVILVQFQDVQFTNSAAILDSLFSQSGYDGTGSFKDYYRDQSGGVFSPGVRVVGPITMPQNKDYYNQTSWLGSTAMDMVRLAITQSDQQVDYSHYDNDNDGVVDAVLIFYAGGRPADNTQGLWPKHSTISGAGTHDGKTFASYAIFDEGESGMPTIGTVCHEFGHCLGLPDLYDVAHNGTEEEQGRTPGVFSLMASGNHNGDGKLPPNLSVLEKSLLGWGAQFDTLQPGDSISLRAIGTANDRAWYLPIDGDEFYAFEVRSGANHWDAGIGMGEGGMIVYHGKESKLNTSSNSVINCTVGDEGWYVVNSHGNEYVSHQVPFGGRNPSSFTPLSFAKPMKNDSTVVDSIWITNIRWKNDSVMLFDFNSDRPHVEILPSTGSDIGELGEMLLQARIISRTGNITSKGIVYSLTEAGCNLEQGTVVYDTSASTTAIAVHLSGLENGTTYYYRAFASNGTHTSFSAIIEMNKHAALRQAHYDAQSGKFLLDLELSDAVSHCYYREYMDEMSLIFGTSMFHNSYGELYNEWEVIDTTGTILANCHIDSATNLASFGLWIFTVAGDTLTDMFTFDPAGIDTIQVHIHDENVESCKVVNDETKLVGKVSWSNQQSGRYWVGVAPRSAVYSAFTYYTDDIICNEYDTICDTASQFKLHLNSSFVYHLLANYTFTEVDSTGRVSLPLLPPDSDSTIVLVSIDRYGAAQASEWNTKVGMKADQAVGAAHLGYESYDATGEYEYGYEQTYFTTDSTLWVEIQPNEFANHYYMLEGTASELAALGVTDTATAVAYRLAHQAEMQRHDCPWLHTGWWDNPSSIMFTTMIDHTHTRTGILPDSDYHVYLFPFNAAGAPSKVERLVFHIKDKFVDVTPAGNGDTAWWYAENGEVVWAWHYDENEPMDDYHMYLAPLGRLDSLCAAAGTDPAGLLPSLMQAGLTRNYGNSLPWSNNSYFTGDTALHLLPDTTYELCLWAVDYLGAPCFQRTHFSTHGAPRFNEAGLKELYFERHFTSSDSVFYCLIDATEATAYYHVIFGEEGSLSAQGITSLATASQYSLSHSSTLEQYTHQTTEIRFEAGTDNMGPSYASYMEFIDGTPFIRAYYCWRKHITQTMSPDSVYRIYVVPYTAAGYQGVGRYIRFSPFYGMYDYSDSAVYGMVTACSVTDISTHSATLHGDIQVGRSSVSRVGFEYLKLDAPLGTEASTIIYGPYTGDPFSCHLTGLQPNTTYRYTVAKAYHSDTAVYSNDVYYTFTTASCTVSASIDTTICYNAYYANHRYTSSQTIEYTYTAANGCDSVLTVNLTVLPQRIGRDTVVLCYGEEYNGAPRYVSITMTETIQEEGLCDSTHALRLEVLPQITATARDTIRGGSYEWGGEVLTEPGQYTHVFTAANGCDSTVTLTLVAEPQEPHEGIGDVDTDQTLVRVDGHTIVVSAIANMAVSIYDASGRLMAAGNGGIRFEAPAAGTYLVQVGDRPAQRVVVAR